MASGQRFDDKAAAREHVWARLQAEKLAAFPFPPRGRIPNFKGARQAAERLFAQPPLNGARAIKVNPDTPQRPVRALALARGITVYMPTPGLTGGFKKLDPAQIPPEHTSEAASLSKTDRWAAAVDLDDLPELDAIVMGAVAATADGRRCGKGEGYADLEYAILRELGHPPVPVATTVHEAQVLEAFPRSETDLPLHCIATPERVIAVADPPPAPSGLVREKLSDADLEAMPVLKEVLERRPGRRPGEPL